MTLFQLAGGWFGFFIGLLLGGALIFIVVAQPAQIELEIVNNEKIGLGYALIDCKETSAYWNEQIPIDLENQYNNRLKNCEEKLYGSSMIKELENCYEDKRFYREQVATDVRCEVVSKNGWPCINSSLLRCSEVEQ
jgi:hypothetical protein